MSDSDRQAEIDAMLGNVNTELTPMAVDQLGVSRFEPITKKEDVVETGKKKTIPVTSNQSLTGEKRVKPYKLVVPLKTKVYTRINSKNGELEQIDPTHVFTQEEVDELAAKMEAENK